MPLGQSKKTYEAPSGTIPGLIYLDLSGISLQNDLKMIQEKILSLLV